MYEMNKELKEKQQDYEETRQQNEVNIFFYVRKITYVNSQDAPILYKRPGFKCWFKTKLYVIYMVNLINMHLRLKFP